METIALSALTQTITDFLSVRFEGQTFRIKAEITDVKKYPQKSWCFLKFIEKQGTVIIAEMKGVFWNKSYASITRFEDITGQPFENGLEITCDVQVKFHQRNGLSLEVLHIELSHLLGSLELERRETLLRLEKEHPGQIKKQPDGSYLTVNNGTVLPVVIQHMALISAPHSDGLRDFKNELANNKYEYDFIIDEYLCIIQGEQAAGNICRQLEAIKASGKAYDAVAIVRGGGSVTDFKPFDNFMLALTAATFPIPILAGIGHDRNTSVLDLMTRQFKTPTKVAAFIIEVNFQFEQTIEELYEQIKLNIVQKLDSLARELDYMQRTIENLSPAKLVQRGFAIVTQKGKVIADAAELDESVPIDTYLKNDKITSNIEKIVRYARKQ